MRSCTCIFLFTGLRKESDDEFELLFLLLPTHFLPPFFLFFFFLVQSIFNFSLPFFFFHFFSFHCKMCKKHILDLFLDSRIFEVISIQFVFYSIFEF